MASRLLISSPLYVRARVSFFFLFSPLVKGFAGPISLSNRFDLINFFGNRIILLSFFLSFFLFYFSLFVSPIGFESIILCIFREVTVNIESIVSIFVFASVATDVYKHAIEIADDRSICTISWININRLFLSYHS